MNQGQQKQNPTMEVLFLFSLSANDEEAYLDTASTASFHLLISGESMHVTNLLIPIQVAEDAKED